MIKQLSKEIMKRSKLCNNFLKNRTEDDPILYKKLRNYCLSLLRKSKKEYYKNLNVREINENKRDRIGISEKSVILKTKSETGETLDDFFSNYSKKFEYFKILRAWFRCRKFNRTSSQSYFEIQRSTMHTCNLKPI